MDKDRFRPSEDGRNEPESDLDLKLAAQFGAYASHTTPYDPIRTEFHGDNPAAETDRLLASIVNEETNILDLGYGAGFTLCRLARKCNSIWGIDLQTDLMEGCKERVSRSGIKNVTLILGDTCHQSVVDQIPDGRFDVAFSRRGPFLTEPLTRKLTPTGVFVVEVAQDFLGLKELFGRKPFLPGSSGDPEWAITAHSSIGFVPVSAKTSWYEEYFTDSDHLAR